MACKFFPLTWEQETYVYYWSRLNSLALSILMVAAADNCQGSQLAERRDEGLVMHAESPHVNRGKAQEYY